MADTADTAHLEQSVWKCVNCSGTSILNFKASFPFGFECGMWDFIVLIPEHCLSIFITVDKL